jgi:hypothetical protein
MSAGTYQVVIRRRSLAGMPSWRARTRTLAGCRRWIRRCGRSWVLAAGLPGEAMPGWRWIATTAPGRLDGHGAGGAAGAPPPRPPALATPPPSLSARRVRGRDVILTEHRLMVYPLVTPRRGHRHSRTGSGAHAEDSGAEPAWNTARARVRRGRKAADQRLTGLRKRSVCIPSAKPTLVRTQHLPPPAEIACELGFPGLAGCCFWPGEVPLSPSESRCV